ncbi:MAG: 2Fe-2S iron-sulfur cluster-binding protein [Bacteroidota bacterium]
MITIKYIEDAKERVLKANKGDNLLQVLKSNHIDVYGSVSSKLNCGGNGLCATCGVYVISGDAKISHWHDQLAEKFGYPRLTCQIALEEDLIIKKPDRKIIWGQLLPKMKKRN